MDTTPQQPVGVGDAGVTVVPTATREVSERSFQALATRDLDTFISLVHPDAEVEFVALNLVCRGRQQVRDFYQGLYDAFPDFHIEATQTVIDGVYAVMEFDIRGTFAGQSFQGIAANGKEVRIRAVSCATFDQGLLRQERNYYDSAAFARQIGMLPTAGGRSERAMTAAFNTATRLRHRLRPRGR